MSIPFAHHDEAHFLQLAGEVVGCFREVSHYAGVSASTESDELVVLGYDVGCWFGEVHGEVQLLGAEVVDVEDEVFGEVLW